MATSGEKRWPPVGIFVATSGEKPMAIDRGQPASLVTRHGRREREPVIRGVSQHALDRHGGLTAAAGVAYQLSDRTAVAGRAWRLCAVARPVIYVELGKSDRRAAEST